MPPGPLSRRRLIPRNVQHAYALAPATSKTDVGSEQRVKAPGGVKLAELGLVKTVVAPGWSVMA